ncbi:MAG: ribosome assembly RNA-binding protein YhbY, partial [Woeseia sp.]
RLDSASVKLSESQKKYLRGLGHQLKPVITVGDAGLSEPVLQEFETTISHHELIKVRVKAPDRKSRDSILEDLCRHGAAELIQRVGNVALIYRRRPDEPRLRLPGYS